MLITPLKRFFCQSNLVHHITFMMKPQIHVCKQQQTACGQTASGNKTLLIRLNALVHHLAEPSLILFLCHAEPSLLFLWHAEPSLSCLRLCLYNYSSFLNSIHRLSFIVKNSCGMHWHHRYYTYI